MPYATKDDVKEIVNKAIKTDVQAIVNKAVTDLSEIIANFAQQVDARFNENEARLTNIEAKLVIMENRLERIEERLDGHDRKYEHLLRTLDTFLGRLDRTELEQLAHDSRFNRLVEWARKVSEKTGIPLKNL